LTSKNKKTQKRWYINTFESFKIFYRNLFLHDNTGGRGRICSQNIDLIGFYKYLRKTCVKRTLVRFRV